MRYAIACAVLVVGMLGSGAESAERRQVRASLLTAYADELRARAWGDAATPEVQDALERVACELDAMVDR